MQLASVQSFCGNISLSSKGSTCSSPVTEEMHSSMSINASENRDAFYQHRFHPSVKTDMKSFPGIFSEFDICKSTSKIVAVKCPFAAWAVGSGNTFMK